jgi:hypothetical protein
MFAWEVRFSEERNAGTTSDSKRGCYENGSQGSYLARMDFAAKSPVSQGRTFNPHRGKRLNALDRRVSRPCQGMQVSGSNHDLIATPQAIEAERAVLGTALIDASSLDVVREALKPFHFLATEHAQAYSAMLELREEGQPIDALLLCARLRERHGFSEQEAGLQVSLLMDGGYKVANVESYARRVIEAEKRRSILRMLPEVERLVVEGKMNPEKSKYSPGPMPKSLTIKVDADENSIKVNADGTNADGTPSHVEYSATFDGKDYPIIGTYADTVSVKRVDANTMQSILKNKGGQVMLTVITTVSTDGKTRTSTFKGTDGQGHDINNIVVYDKQVASQFLI